MSRKNVVGNHIHVIYYEERGERERDRINFYLVRSMKKLNTIFFTQHGNGKTLF